MVYKVIPGPTTIQGTVTEASNSFEAIINDNARAGWKYHSMETITSYQKPGCLSRDAVYITSYMLIFYKED